MKKLLKAVLLVAAITPVAGATTKSRELTVALSESREVIVAVPEGFSFEAGNEDNGPIIKVTDPKDTVTVDIQILPDPERKFANARARTEQLNEIFFNYVASSTEKAMQFEELDPRVGAGTYCVFTDASLVGKTKLPPGEYLHLTAGIKAWPGAIAIIRCFSNDTTSAGYKAVLTMLRESVHEKPVPLR